MVELASTKLDVMADCGDLTLDLVVNVITKWCVTTTSQFPVCVAMFRDSNDITLDYIAWASDNHAARCVHLMTQFPCNPVQVECQ